MTDAVREIEAAYQAYMDSFNNGDGEAFVRTFGYPNVFLIKEFGIKLVHADARAMSSFYETLMASLKERGWARTTVDECEVTLLTDDLALVFADFTRYREDGSVLEPGRAHYTLTRESDAWTIRVVTAVPRAG
jgi:ketosteroid isomerase-like protein